MKQKQQETQLTPVKPRKWQGGGEGCVIEARGISYKIYTAGPGANPFKIWSAKDDTSSDGGGEEERKGCAATAAASAAAGQDRCPLQQQHQQLSAQSKLTAIAEDGGEGYDTGDDEECGGGLHRLHPLKTPQQDKGATGHQQQHVRHVLRDVTCRARPWEVLAIVGPSGAGKSTLLEIMAGRLPLPTTAPHAVLVDGQPLDPARFRMSSGYVPQKDTLFPLLTVRETLLFTARLRLGLRGEALVAKVESLLGELGLAHVAAARVGDDRCRGISGGERRRVSIGVEVIHDPGVLLLDEPTSGLDSSSALQIVDMLRTMAEVRGRTVVLSIHQPGFRIVKMFNTILLLAGGAVVHHGSVDKLQDALRAAGLEQPPYTNVVEFAMDSIDALRRYQRRQMQTKKLQLLEAAAAAAAAHMPPAAAAATPNPDRCTLQQLFLRSKAGEEPLCTASPPVITGGLCCSNYANSWPTETAILTHRYLKNVFRTKELFACRTIQMLVSGLVLGSIFYRLPSGLASARERVGLFAFLLTFLLSSTTEALPIFLQERAILMKEASGGSYRVSSYAVANALAFLPFLLVLSLLFSVPLYWLVGLDRSPSSFLYFLLLIWLVLYTANSVVACFGAVAPNFIVGNSLINGVLGAFFLFSGYFIRKEEMPSYWVFMHYISLFKYPFEGFLVNEFRDRCLEQGKAGVCLVRGGDVMREVGLDEESRWTNVAVMVGLIALYRFLAYVFLACRCRCAQKGGLRRALT